MFYLELECFCFWVTPDITSTVTVNVNTSIYMNVSERGISNSDFLLDEEISVKSKNTLNFSDPEFFENEFMWEFGCNNSFFLVLSFRKTQYDIVNDCIAASLFFEKEYFLRPNDEALEIEFPAGWHMLRCRIFWDDIYEEGFDTSRNQIWTDLKSGEHDIVLEYVISIRN